MVGFFAKLGVFRAAWEADLTLLVVAAGIASVIGVFYYLRIVYYMYFGEEGDALDRGTTPIAWVFLMGSAALMLLGLINMFGIDTLAAAAAETLVK
jgi:NADH-quinone oxidoreductase subunit N